MAKLFVHLGLTSILDFFIDASAHRWLDQFSHFAQNCNQAGSNPAFI